MPIESVLATLKTIIVFGTTVLAVGCTPLQPYAEIRTQIPDDRFVTVDGSQVYVEQWGVGDPVLLIHGFGGSSHNWVRVADELSDRYQLVAPDLRGFGWSERPHEYQAYSFENQVETVLGVLDALEIDRAHVVGHSYGGGVALWLASRHPERVRSLVLVGSTLPGTEFDTGRRLRSAGPLTPIAVRWMLRPSFLRNALESSYYDPGKVDEALVEEYRERLRVEGVNRAFRGLTAESSRPQGSIDIDALEMPTLVLWGSEDPLLPAESGQRFAEAIPDGTFVAIPKCGHTPMEEMPAAFVAAIEPFLSR